MLKALLLWALAAPVAPLPNDPQPLPGLMKLEDAKPVLQFVLLRAEILVDLLDQRVGLLQGALAAPIDAVEFAQLQADLNGLGELYAALLDDEFVDSQGHVLQPMRYELYHAGNAYPGVEVGVPYCGWGLLELGDWTRAWLDYGYPSTPDQMLTAARGAILTRHAAQRDRQDLVFQLDQTSEAAFPTWHPSNAYLGCDTAPYTLGWHAGVWLVETAVRDARDIYMRTSALAQLAELALDPGLSVASRARLAQEYALTLGDVEFLAQNSSRYSISLLDVSSTNFSTQIAPGSDGELSVATPDLSPGTLGIDSTDLYTPAAAVSAVQAVGVARQILLDAHAELQATLATLGG